MDPEINLWTGQSTCEPGNQFLDRKINWESIFGKINLCTRHLIFGPGNKLLDREINLWTGQSTDASETGKSNYEIGNELCRWRRRAALARLGAQDRTVQQVSGSEFRVQGPGFRVQGGGWRVEGGGLRVGG